MMDDTARFDVDNESGSKDKTVGSTNFYSCSKASKGAKLQTSMQ